MSRNHKAQRSYVPLSGHRTFVWLLLTNLWRCKQNTTFRPITGNKYSTFVLKKYAGLDAKWMPDLKPSFSDITPLRSYSRLMNCFNKVIFLRFYNELNFHVLSSDRTRGQSTLTKSASRGGHSPVRGHPRGSKFVPLNSWGRVSY